MDPMNPSTDQPTGGLPASGAVPPAADVPPRSAADVPPPVWSMPPSPVPLPPVVPAIPPAPTRRRRDPLTILMVVAAFVALGGVGFAVGRVTAPAAAAAANGRGQFGNGTFTNPGGSFAPGDNGVAGFGRGGLSGGVALTGTITEVTADHIVLKLANGSTLTIPVNGSTAYHRQASATSSDVTTGTTVQVQLSVGGTNGTGVGQQPSASGAPGTATRVLGTASDITIVGQ